MSGEDKWFNNGWFQISNAQARSVRSRNVPTFWEQSRIDEAIETLHKLYDQYETAGDKESAEAVYQQVYELREYMNARHAGKIWRKSAEDAVDLPL